MARGRPNRQRVTGVVALLAVMLAGFCVLSSIQQKYGYDFGLPELALPSLTEVFGGIEDIPREPVPMAETPILLDPVEPSSTRDTLTVHQINMGQADSILIVGPQRVVLIDAGENGQGEEVVRYLKAQGIESIDLLIGTHPHSDHIGGLDTVMNSMPVAEVMLPVIPEEITPTTVTYTDVLNTIIENDIPFTPAGAGLRYELGNGAALSILGPVGEYTDLNNLSIVCRVVYGATSFLFTGDIEKKAEQDLIESGALLRADVLSVGHHGSNTSSSQVFLDAVKPQAALISCGLDNSYGHPHREVMERLAAMNVRVYRTDLHGTIKLVSDGTTIGIEKEFE